VLEGIEYINLSCLLKTAPFAAYFAKHYKSVKRFLEEEKDIEVFTVSKQKIAKGVFEHKEAFSSGCDLRLAKKDGKINDFIERAQSASHPMAPAILVDNDLTFTDVLGSTHDVEMRGERTEKGIYFKVKDIGQVFGSSKLVENIQLEHTQLEENEDYVWFTIPDNERKKHGSSRELFFTHSGMIVAVCISKSPVAKQFRKWVSQIVFVHRYGTDEQKQELAKSLLNKKTIDEVTKRCATDIACVYLLETSIPSRQENGITKRVYKFGYSKNVKDRMDKHVLKYGRESVIDTLIFLPVNYLSEAETKLKHTLGKKYTHEDSTETELLLLSDDERNTVRNAMRTVGETFYGETVVHTHQLEMLKKDHELEMSNKDQVLITAKKDVEVAKKDVEVAKKDVEVAKKDVEVAKRDIVILEMKNEIQARRIQELEEKLRRCKKNNANAA
jgi:prophage antirepressor-like protein